MLSIFSLLFTIFLVTSGCAETSFRASDKTRAQKPASEAKPLPVTGSSMVPLFTDRFAVKGAKPASGEWRILTANSKAFTLLKSSVLKVDLSGNINWNGCVAGAVEFPYEMRLGISRDGGKTFETSELGSIGVPNAGRDFSFSRNIEFVTGQVVVVQSSVKHVVSAGHSDTCVSDDIINGVIDLTFTGADDGKSPIGQDEMMFNVSPGFRFAEYGFTAELQNPVLDAVPYEANHPATDWKNFLFASEMSPVQIQGSGIVRATLTSRISVQGCDRVLNFKPELQFSGDGGSTFSSYSHAGVDVLRDGVSVLPVLVDVVQGQSVVLKGRIRFQDMSGIQGACASSVKVDGELKTAVFPKL
jgi:hypothetical protein